MYIYWSSFRDIKTVTTEKNAGHQNENFTYKIYLHCGVGDMVAA